MQDKDLNPQGAAREHIILGLLLNSRAMELNALFVEVSLDSQWDAAGPSGSLAAAMVFSC